MNDAEILQDKIINPKDIQITIAEGTSRKIDPKLEEEANKEWLSIFQKAQEDGLNTWDGIFYRLDNLDEVMKGSLEFKLSTVKYSQIRAFQKLKVSENYPIEYHTLHMGTLGVVRTNDGYYVFGFREKSLNLSKLSFIGGGLQQDEIEVRSGEDIERNMFKELKEELGVDERLVKKIDLTKIVWIKERMNVFILFNLDLSINKDEVLDSYEHLNDKEHDKLIFIKEDELKDFIPTMPSFMQIAFTN